MGELQSALKLHEAGRESLRKRLVEKEHLLEQTRIAAVGKVQSVEQLRDEQLLDEDALAPCAVQLRAAEADAFVARAKHSASGVVATVSEVRLWARCDCERGRWRAACA